MRGQQTLSEIDAATRAARQRAYQFETLTSAKESCVKGIAMLEARIAHDTTGPLRNLIKAAEAIDPSYETQGRGLDGALGGAILVTRGLELRALVIQEGTAALRQAEKLRAELETTLDKVRIKLAETIDALKEFEEA